MSTRPAHAALTISVDLEPEHLGVAMAQQRALDGVAGELLDLFAKHGLPATWAVADPALSAARARLEAAPRHELAILGDASWVGLAAGRGRFARELSRRVTQARGHGIEIATLALRTPLPAEHCDLASKEGIRAVRQPHGERSGTSGSLEKLRFGLWGFAISRSLPGTSRWLPGGGGTRAARYEIDRAITGHTQLHLAIDAARLAERGSAAVRVVQRVVEHAARRRERKLIEVTTLGRIAERMSQENTARPSRSILRPAA